MWHIVDDEEARAIVDRLVDAVPSGSYLALADPTVEATGDRMRAAIENWNEHGTPPGTWRSPEQLAGFFERLELVEPGIVSCTRWRPEPSPFEESPLVDRFCGVGRKP